jgi:hypothetical protein
MRRSSIVLVALPTLLIGAVLFVAADDGVSILDSDLRQLRVSLDGAPHYYALTPEMGRVVLRRAPAPSEDETEHDVLVVTDSDGRQIFKRSPGLDLPYPWDGHVIDASLRAPDRLVMTANVERTTFILAEYDLGSGELVRSAPTNPIFCFDLQGDDEGTTWCLGRDASRIRDDLDYDLVYRFDASGTLLSSSLPRSAFPESINPTGLKRCCRKGQFLPGQGEVRLWLPAVGELVSFDGDGEVRERVTLPEVEDLLKASLVTAPGNEVYALLSVGPDHKDSTSWTQTLVRLAPDGAAWLPVEGAPQDLPPSFFLVGADHGGLILFDRSAMTMVWYPLPFEEADAGS